MTISATLAADLGLLTAALDEPGADVDASLCRLAADAHTAVRSYLGLSIVVDHTDPTFTMTTLTAGAAPDDIHTSLRMPLEPGNGGHGPPVVAIVLYAATPGAFVDLAADLAWLTGRALRDFALDRHLAAAAGPDSPTPLAAGSAVNQALGVLIGRGYTPQQAEWQLDLQAGHAGTDRRAAACLVLAKLTAADTEHDFDIH